MKKYPSIYTVEDVHVIRSTTAAKIDGRYVTARPVGLQTVFGRFHCAWLVFTGRADALTWPGGQ
jgi:hypothetical protein